MSIVFDENLDLFCLETANTSYIIGLADHRTFVGHVYYGRRVRRQDLRYLLRTGEAPFVPSGNERECCSFYDTFPAEYSGNGVGDYRESSIAVRTQAGQHAVMPTYVSYEITDQKPELPGLPSAFDREHTAQTLILRCRDEVLQLDVDLYYTVFEENGLEKEVERTVKAAEEKILSGRTVVIYTSRQLLAPENMTPEEKLHISVKISNAVTSIIGKLSVKPKFIIAKGGITSSDVGTKALRVKKARVMGQVKKGIPVWMTGEESKFPGMPYIIFPGNVGEVSTLKEIVEELI